MHKSELSRRGEIAVLMVMVRAAELGLVVSRPTTDAVRYDLVIDVAGRLYRVQVKYANGSSANAAGVAQVELRRNGRGYTSDEIDALLVYLPATDRVYWLTPDVWEGRSVIQLRYQEARNGQRVGCLMAEGYIW